MIEPAEFPTIQILAKPYPKVLTPEALVFLADLQQLFGPRIEALLAAEPERAARKSCPQRCQHGS